MGFTYYDEGAYKIELPTQAKRVIDTLRKDSVYAKMIDTLIFKINRAAELTGNRIKSDVLTSIITNITFPNPHKTLHGKVDAITNYVKINYELLFINQLTSSILSEQFNKLKIIQTWNELQQHYFEITGLYSSIDILTPSAKKLEEGFFKEMAIEEELIRTDPTHRGPTTGNFRAIFATIK